MPASARWAWRAGDVGLGTGDGDDGAAVGLGIVGAEDLPAAGLEGGHEAGALAEEFGGDGVDAEFEDEFEGGAGAGEPSIEWLPAS